MFGGGYPPSKKAKLNDTAPGSSRPSNVLLMRVTNIMYPVTIDSIHAIFSRFGTIHKIVMFEKGAGFQVMVEYPDVPTAVTARDGLHNQHMYEGCNILRIGFSNLSTITVRRNSERSWDYTPEIAAAAGGRGMGSRQMSHPVARKNSGSPRNEANAGQKRVLLVRGVDAEQVTPEALVALFGLYGNVLRVKMLDTEPMAALIQMSTQGQARAALDFLHGAPLAGNVLSVALSRQSSLNGQLGTGVDFNRSPLHRFAGVLGVVFESYLQKPSASLFIANLAAGTTKEALEERFAVHANTAEDNPAIEKTSGVVCAFVSGDEEEPTPAAKKGPEPQQHEEGQEEKAIVGQKQTAIVTMPDVESAVHALIMTHNSVLDGHLLYVNFAKKIAA